jgi:hypothetical protein
MGDTLEAMSDAITMMYYIAVISVQFKIESDVRYCYL